MQKKLTHSAVLLIALACWLSSFSALAANLPDFTELVDANSAAVVNISTSQQAIPTRGILPPGIKIPENTPYGDLFKHFFGSPGRQAPQNRPAKSLGSGFIISNDGYILTNHHVVGQADEIIVRLQDRRELMAELIGSDERTDVALLKVDATDLPVVTLGSSEQLKVGEWVFAIGSPFGFDSSVTAGIVSAKGRSLPRESYVPFIQTDVAINPGNSGGPLFNLSGEVVGVNSQIYSRTGGFMGLSFAIPISVAMNVADQIKNTGHVDRGWLGVRIQDVTRELAESFEMDKPQGALVAQVIAGSPAEKAGIEVGDVIIKYNDKEVIKSSSLPPMVGASSLNKKAKVSVVRNKQIKHILVTLENLPEDAVLAGGKSANIKSNMVLGLLISDLNDKLREQSGITEGAVYIHNVSDGAGAKAGIRAGDIITQLGSIKIKGAQHFKDQLGELEEGKSIAILINRGGHPIFLALRK